MVNIKLIDKWRIKSDKLNWMLIKEVGGRELYEGYYSHLETCIESFIEKKLKLSEATSISGLLAYHKSLLSALNKSLTPFKITIKREKGEENGTRE